MKNCTEALPENNKSLGGGSAQPRSMKLEETDFMEESTFEPSSEE